MTRRILIAMMMLATVVAVAPRAHAQVWQIGTFVTDLPSSAPTGLVPTAGATLAYPTDTIKFSWNPVAGARKYRIVIARQESATADCSLTSAFSSSKIIESRTVDETLWVPTLKANDGDTLFAGTYCWRVRAAQSSDSSFTFGWWSQGLRFTRTWAATSPSGLKFFDDESDTIPRSNEATAAASTSTRLAGYLYWTPVAGASKYDVEIYTSPSLSPDARLVHSQNSGGNRLLLPRLPDDEYYWRVRAIDAAGVPSNWSSGSNTFTVAWTASSWASAGNISPVNAGTASSMLIGWSPMQGASGYEVQAATRNTCFTTNDTIGNYWGDWINRDPTSATVGATTEYYPAPPGRDDCKLNQQYSTINNYAYSRSIVDQAVIDNIWNSRDHIEDGEYVDGPCKTDASANEDGFKCVPVPVFHSGCGGSFAGAGPWPGDYSGVVKSDGTAADNTTIFNISSGATYKDLFDAKYDCDGSATGPRVYWRVRPTFSVSGSEESSWTVSGTFNLHGRWVEYDNSAAAGTGAVQPLYFLFNPAAITPVSAGHRCESPDNPTGDQCLVYDLDSGDSSSPMRMAVNDLATTSSTHQFPLVSWQPFPQAHQYRVDIAKDAQFNNIVYQDLTDETIWAPDKSLPDGSASHGYWIRVVPCNLFDSGAMCSPLYYAASTGTYIDADPAVNPSSIGYQKYDKASTVELEITDDFAGTTPLLQVYKTGATSVAQKAAGMDSSSYYEFQFSHMPTFSDATTMKSSVPRFVPFEGSADAKQTLSGGVWYVRARSVCTACSLLGGDLSSSWSDVKMFSQDIAAPVITSPAGQYAVNPIVAWSGVNSADSYDVQFSDDPAITDADPILVTRQTSALLDVPTTGVWFWRVRAHVGNVTGAWSEVDETGPYVTVDSHPTIEFDDSSQGKPVIAGTMVNFDGLLKVHGYGNNGESVQLQKKSSVCNATGGSWSEVSTVTTGDDGEEGTARVAAMVDRNRCYRWAWNAGSRMVYSAPIAVKSFPKATITTASTTVRRAANFGVTLKSTAELTGRVRVQYKVGSTWYTIKTASLTGQKTYTFQAQIQRSGEFRLRAVLDQLVTAAGDPAFVDTQVGGPIVRVNDLWTSYS